MPTPEEMALLERAITASGLTASEFARQVLARDPRTVRRWRNDRGPMPLAVTDFLLDYVKRRPASRGGTPS